MSTDARGDGRHRLVELPVDLSRLEPCFEGAVPAVIATASADGTPNVTYLSRVRLVDGEHVALSNQFFSKTSRNLTENHRASMLMLHPTTYDEYQLQLEYERTERRGPIFDRLREDVDAVASVHGMQDVYRLRSADIYRVVSLVLHPAHVRGELATPAPRRQPLDPALDAERLAELTRRVSRSADLDMLVSTVVDSLDELFGHRHAILLLADERVERLYTIASHGYEEEGVGSEVVVGEGIVGIAASRCRPIRIGNMRQMTKYSSTVRRSIEHHEGVVPGREVPLPGLPGVQSILAVPAQAFGELVGVLVVESEEDVAFDDSDQRRIEVVASLVGSAVEVVRSRARNDAGTSGAAPVRQPGADRAASTLVRFFPVDGSTFIDGDYLIKGVAGRILWALLQANDADGRTEFTNREVRLDPSLELPEFRDNFESRLILLKRRLDERAAPVRIEKTGRGRFRLVVATPLRLETVE